MARDYEVTIKETSRELTPRERIMVKDFSNAAQLDEVTAEGGFCISPAFYAILAVHNEKSEKDKDYTKYLIIDAAGNKFITGSNSFFKSFMEIWEEMQPTGEEYQIECYRVPSKNYKGKSFLTCSIV